MMKNPKIEVIAANIATVTAQCATLTSLIAPRRAARLLIEGAISAAMAAHGSATAALQDAIVRDAVGEADAGEVAVARATVATAEKALTTARKREGEARELAAAEAGLTARVEPLERSLVELRTELAAAAAAARIAAIESELHSGIAEYTALATRTMAALARAVARHQYLVEAGRAPELMNPGIVATACGSFTGYPVLGNVADMMQVERRRIADAMRA